MHWWEVVTTAAVILEQAISGHFTKHLIWQWIKLGLPKMGNCNSQQKYLLTMIFRY